MIIIGYVAGHLRYKFNKKKRIDHSFDDDSDVHKDRNNFKGRNIHQEQEEESIWYDCLAAAPHGGISISGAWTSDNVFLEVRIVCRKLSKSKRNRLKGRKFTTTCLLIFSDKCRNEASIGH